MRRKKEDETSPRDTERADCERFGFCKWGADNTLQHLSFNCPVHAGAREPRTYTHPLARRFEAHALDGETFTHIGLMVRAAETL